MGARRYGPPQGRPPITMSEYHQSRDELEGLPQTVTEKIPVTNTPNIFSYRSYIFAKSPEMIRRFVKATKADVGGVGGHVVAADEVKSIIAKYVLDNNVSQGRTIYSSLIVTHTGDDIGVTGIVDEHMSSCGTRCRRGRGRRRSWASTARARIWSPMPSPVTYGAPDRRR